MTSRFALIARSFRHAQLHGFGSGCHRRGAPHVLVLRSLHTSARGLTLDHFGFIGDVTFADLTEQHLDALVPTLFATSATECAHPDGHVCVYCLSEYAR